MSIGRRWRRGPSRDDRLTAELHDHIERHVADLMTNGLNEAEARRRVRLEFGGLDQAMEACRDARPRRWLDDLVRDVRVGFRGLGRDRLFAMSVATILALGLGASVAMFSVLHAVVLRPLPYAAPDELVTVTSHLMVQDRPDGSSLANLQDWRNQSRTMVAMTYYLRTSVSGVTFAGVDAPQRAQEGMVGPEFFSLLGATPLLGRPFSREEFDALARVVVLSEGLWREQFGGSREALGQRLWIDGADHVIVGVMPGTFQLPAADIRFWRPYSLFPNSWPQALSARHTDAIEVIGRLAPGVRVEDADAEMRVVAARLREAHEVNRNIDVRVAPLRDRIVGGRVRRGVWLAFAAVLCLLVIACANVGGLLSTRASRRRRELAVRAALGAGRARLVRQLLAESVSLWIVASLAGVPLAYALIRLLLTYGPRTLPRFDQVGLDLTALGVALLGGLIVVIVCGTIPALLAAKIDASEAFGTRDPITPPPRRLQDLLVAGQIAGALMLLVGALLFAQSFMRAQREDPGYPAAHLLIARIALPQTAYPDRAAVSAFVRSAADRVGALPGVVAVGGITDFFIRRNADQWVTIDGGPEGRDPGSPRLAVESVTPGYFRAVGIDVLEGRDFDARDYEPGAPGVFIISDTLARRLWPGDTAIGKRIVGGERAPKNGRWSTVVGVVRDMRREGLDIAPILGAFVPSFPRIMDLTIRVSADANSLIPAIRREIRAIDAALPITQVIAADGHLAEGLGGRRFETQILTAFAAVALILSAAGLYALLAYQVAIRTREIGIRSALGADRRTILAMVLAKGLRLAAAGVLVGIAGAAAGARVMQSLLYQTPALDPLSYVAVTAFVLLVATVAAWLPARRAVRVSPMTALREE
jgi:predicted permease